MIKLIQSIFSNALVITGLFLIAGYFLVRYWDKKRKKDLRIKEGEKKYMDELLDFDYSEKYMIDDGEVEYDRK